NFATVNAAGDVAFVVQTSAGNSVLELKSHPSANSAMAQVPSIVPLASFPNLPDLRPAMSDDGSVVIRAGDSASSPVMLYLAGRAPVTIAGSDTFSELGRRPGISADGTFVVFYGNLKAAALDRLNTDNAGVV